MKVPVSVVIPVLNEASNLGKCLEAVSWADEVFVVDSESSDGSLEIAQEHGAKAVQFHFDGAWPKKKNWALDNLPFSHDWVLILDADEVLEKAAEEEIREICTTNKQGFDGYFINRCFIFMGRQLKHSYQPNWNLRLFKRKLGRYEKLTDLPTYSGDVEIHEHVILKGRAGYLRSQMQHYAFPTAEAFVLKHNRYSNWEARVAVRPLKSGIVGWRRRIKIISQYLPFRPFLRFFYIYILEGGFLDGKEGYYFARLHAFYEFLCICKTYELKKALKDKKSNQQ